MANYNIELWTRISMDALGIIKSSLYGFVMGIVRNLLVTATTWFVSRKLMDAATSSQIETFIPIVLAAVAWSFIDKYVIAKLHLERVLKALDLTPGSTLAHLDEAMKQKPPEEKLPV